MLDKISERRAAMQYEAIRGFYVHFSIYVLVGLVLVLVNVLFSEKMWAHFALGGWGAGILAHAYCAFVTTPKRLATWEAAALARAQASSAPSAP